MGSGARVRRGSCPPSVPRLPSRGARPPLVPRGWCRAAPRFRPQALLAAPKGRDSRELRHPRERRVPAVRLAADARAAGYAPRGRGPSAVDARGDRQARLDMDGQAHAARGAGSSRRAFGGVRNPHGERPRGRRRGLPRRFGLACTTDRRRVESPTVDVDPVIDARCARALRSGVAARSAATRPRDAPARRRRLAAGRDAERAGIVRSKGQDGRPAAAAAPAPDCPETTQPAASGELAAGCLAPIEPHLPE